MTKPRTLADWAKLTPAESVAQWRIASAVWAGRALAIVWLLSTLIPAILTGQLSVTLIVFVGLVCASVYLAAERVKRGSRSAAIFLLTLFLADKAWIWYQGDGPWYQGALLSLIVIFCLVQGVWGTFLLAAERRKQRNATGVDSTIAA